jgi:pyrroline-5-carboxylate reductase
VTPEILLVGFGNMGKALAAGWVRAGREARTIAVTDARGEVAEDVRARGHVWLADTTSTLAEVVVIAVKPQQLAACLADHGAACRSASVVLSIVAGKTLREYAAAIGHEQAMVRAMPNTPAAIAEGVTVLCANAAVSPSDKKRCASLMSAVGGVHWVEDESLLDAVTAISGSGPAYVFLFIECLTEAGISAGLPPELAHALALQTVAGAALYARAAGVPLRELRRQVTSPGGTTEAALAQLTANDALLGLIDAAVAAAAARSRELSQS